MEISTMKITFLGTGTSQGVPVIACDCDVCRSKEKNDKRLRSSICIQLRQKTMVIDCGPDFRQQILREEITHLDALFLTHSHRDHTAGLDELRSFNYVQQGPIPIHAQESTLESIRNDFSYIFEPNPYPGVPQVDLHPVYKNQAFYLDDIKVIPIEVMHLQMPVLGFRIGDFTYITDANRIEPSEMEKIKGTRVLVINALRKEKHPSHFNLEEALQIVNEIKPEKTYLTHISHLMGFHKEVSQELPEQVFLSYDGLTLSV